MAHAKREKKQSDQFRDFRKAARELGADESKEGFENVLRTLAKGKPQPSVPKGKPRDQGGG